MTDTSTADELPPQTNGVASDYSGMDDEEKARIRPADIDADVREMERRKRVELIMNSKLFREELERIIETQLKDGSGTSGLLQQISDMVGVNKQGGNVFKNSSCVIPINDIRGIESMGYAKGEKILRCKLAAVFRLIDLYGWTQGANTLITARLNQEEEQFLVNPYGMLFHEITASSLIKVDMQGAVLEQGTTNFSVNVTAFSLHAAVHAARPDIRCIIHIHTPSVVAVSALKYGLMPLSQESVVIGDVSTHPYLGGLLDADEKDKLARNLGPINKVLLLSNQGALCCGETIEETFFNARNMVLAAESQLKVLPLGLDNLVLLNDEARKKIYDAAHKAPESSPRPDQPSILEGKVERKWRVGGIEFEALMRMMDNAGFRTGYIYRHPLVKGEPPKPRNDVEVPPAVSSLGYLLEEEELYRQGLWKKFEGGRKGHDRSRWLNSPNVYQKVEILETGTPDPKKITKWVADGSPNHSTPVRIDTALQFVPPGTNPKEFKQKQQQIKDYRRADKISAGPQSHILEGVTWEEARKMQDAAVTQTGDQVVLMGAASKGIIQRGHQHNAMMYKSPYAKNPFDSVTDEEIEDYKKVVEQKSKGDYDTDFSESDGLSSAQINKRIDSLHLRSPTSVTSETEEESRDEPQILRIETRTAPKPSQPEVVLSDVESSPVEQFIRAERTSVNSYKNYEETAFDAINPQFQKKYYRTNSHAGFPTGSYAIPNPVHYHIARQTQIAKIMRPVIVSLVHKSTSGFGYNNLNRQSHYVRKDSVISFKLNDAHSVALDISLDTLKAFICPFAKALNLVEIPIINSQGCQTSYMTNFDRRKFTRDHLNNVEYTPLYVDPHSNTLHISDKSSSFEKDIMNGMRKNLVAQFNVCSERHDSKANNSRLNETVEFTENDEMSSNESLAQISPDLAITLPETSSSKSSSTGKTYNIEELNMDDKEIVEFSTEPYANGKQNAENEEYIGSNSHGTSGKPYDMGKINAATALNDEVMHDLEINKSNIEESTHLTPREMGHVDTNNLNELREVVMCNLSQLTPKFQENDMLDDDDIKVYKKEDEELQINPVDHAQEETSLVRHDNSLATIENESFFEKAEGTRDSISQSIVEVADKFSTEFLKVVDDYEVAMDVINEVKQILNGCQNDKCSPPKSIDEGIEDPSVTVNNANSSSFVSLNSNIDERIVRLGLVIKDYLTEQGFEIKELLVFPELLNDQNTEKLLSKLISLYKELYPEPLGAEDKNEIRLSIANYVLNLLKLDDRFQDTSGESDNFLNISDKIFSMSEYISEMLDKFFEAIDHEEFASFSRQLSDQSCVQSTPGKRKECIQFQEAGKNLKIVEAQPEVTYIDESVTSFKKDSKVTSESFWFSISPLPLKVPAVPTRRAIINVDDIPLRPPTDLNNEELSCEDNDCVLLNSECSRVSFKEKVDNIPFKPSKCMEPEFSKTALSPILEETKVNLFDSHLPSDYEILEDPSVSFDYEIIDSDDSRIETERCLSSDKSNGINNNERESSDSSTEVNIVVCNEIKFIRTSSRNVGFSKRSNVVFTTDVSVKNNSDVYKNDENKENQPLNDSGDWMGFERAKF